MRNTLHVLRLVAFMSASIAGALSSPLNAQLAVDFTQRTVTVQGMEPSAAIVLVGVAREPAGAIVKNAAHEAMLEDEDGDGSAGYEPPNGVAARSIWIAVDLRDGAVTVAAPPGSTAVLMRPYGRGEGVPAQAVGHNLEVGREQVHVVIVRPGVGAWARKVRDGGDADRDRHSDGRLRLDVSKLRPLDEAFGPAPPALRPGDVLAVLDAERLEYWHGTAAGGGH